MNTLSSSFIKGLLALLPLTITIAVLYWLGSTAEMALGTLIQWLLPDDWYYPGMGIVSGFFIVLVTGLLLNAYLFRRLVEHADQLLEKIPLVKLIYGSVRDISNVAGGGGEDELKKAVLASVTEDLQVIGFITGDPVAFIKGEKHYPVYLPMSYQVGGYTLFLPENRFEPLDMSVQDAMRYALTAGMALPEQKTDPTVTD